MRATRHLRCLVRSRARQEHSPRTVSSRGGLLSEALDLLKARNVPLVSIMHTEVEYIDACLDVVATLLEEHPRPDHRTTLHHFGVSTAAQVRRLTELGVQVSANGYYLRQFGDAFADQWLGVERASLMTRVGSVKAGGSTVSAHSDLPMGPLLPMQAAANLATRRTASDRVMGPAERLSPADALATVTIDAARQLRLDHLIGSLASGKCADMVALGADPFETDPFEWDDIDVVGTVFRGEVVAR